MCPQLQGGLAGQLCPAVHGLSGPPVPSPTLPSPGLSRARVGDARECWGHLQPLFFLSPLQTRGAYLPFGALAGLLGPLTCEPTSSSRQLAAACLSSLLHIQGECE